MGREDARTAPSAHGHDASGQADSARSGGIVTYHMTAPADLRGCENRARPTPRQLAVMAVVCRADSHKAAAHELGVTYSAVHASQDRLYAALGVGTGLQAAAALGWLVVPVGV